MTAKDIEIINDRLHNSPPETAVFIAEDEHGTSLGFIHLTTGTDYYFEDKHGHISDIIVAPEGEGQGIGSRLMAKAEEWARSSGYRRLSLSVFAQNLRAREVYERLGYGADIIKYVKDLT